MIAIYESIRASDAMSLCTQRALPIVHKVHQKGMIGYKDDTCFDDIAESIVVFPLPKLTSGELPIACALSRFVSSPSKCCANRASISLWAV